MVVSDNEEIIRVRSRIEELLTKDRELKTELKENNRNIEITEKYLASLLGTTVSEISSVKSIGDHLEEILRKKNQPMKAQELLQEIRIIPGLEDTALPTVTTNLIRNSNNKKRFNKVAPNTYEALTKKKEEEDM